MDAYSTIQDVIDREILPALGDDVGDFDVVAIADEAFGYVPQECGYLQVVDTEQFWAIAHKHQVRN